MEQTILAVIRPKLNMSQPKDQLLHLIEHILMSPERLSKIGISEKHFAKDIIWSNGSISELFCVEYFIVRSAEIETIKKLVLNGLNHLHLDKVDLGAIKKNIVQEIEEDNTKEISMGEQFAKAIYTKDSPILRQPWNDAGILKNLDLDHSKIEKMFKKFGKPFSIVELSFNRYRQSEKISVEKNFLNSSAKPIQLKHPYQSPETTAIDILIPVNFGEQDFINFDLYRTILADYDFGILYKKMRQKGLVYDLGVNYNLHASAIQIYFSCDKNRAEDALNYIKELSANEKIISKDFLELTKDKTIMSYEIEWGNISDSALGYIKEFVLGNFHIAPKERIAKMRKISIDEINNFHNKIVKNFKNNALIPLLNYGKKVETNSH
ncbi:MAG: hypothetical protein NTW79_02285 [Candidatus Berkelbacteria bacterium]|nr:hypothetical protein [Candidatus Berkelbacteria bacterium]